MRSMCTAVIIVLAGLVAAEAQDSLVEETRSPLAGAELGLFFDVNFEEEAVLGRLFLPGIPRLAAELLYYPPIPWEDALNYTYTTSGFQANVLISMVESRKFGLYAGAGFVDLSMKAEYTGGPGLFLGSPGDYSIDDFSTFHTIVGLRWFAHTMGETEGSEASGTSIFLEGRAQINLNRQVDWEDEDGSTHTYDTEPVHAVLVVGFKFR